MQNLLTNTPSPLPAVPEFDTAPADLLEQIEAAQNESADAMDASTQTTARAIEDALSVAGIKSPALKAEGAKMMQAELPILLHLAAEMFRLRHDEPDLHFFEALREAIDTRERRLRYWNAQLQAGGMVGAFQDWLEEESERLKSQIDLLTDEISNLAPLAKTARRQGFNEELVARYNALCATLFEAKDALALIEANADLTHFNPAELPNASAGALLLWERFCGEGFD